MTAALSRFNFQGDNLEIVRNDGDVLVGVRPICESLGVDVAGQLVKLQADPSVTVEMISMVAADGKNREIACIPLRALPLWLATIHPNKVKAAVREKLIAYRREAAEVLADHFLGPRTPPAMVARPCGKPLTKRQAEILEYLRAYAKTFGAPPTYREISAHFAIGSTNAVHDHLVMLQRKGAIRLREGKARGIILPPEPAAPAPAPPAPTEPASEIAELRAMVTQLVGAVAALAGRQRRPRLPAPGQRDLPFPEPGPAGGGK